MLEMTYAFTALFFTFNKSVACVAATDMEDGQVVETKQGQLKGRTQTVSGKTVQVYFGIPYAEPPINHLRFRKPTPSKSWSGAYDATQKKFSCPQQLYPSLADIATDLSEDCLYLNVWTPSTVRPTRPVVVWIHGGGFAFGSSYESGFNGSLLAVMHDLVVVTMNYRLGIFGFLDAGVPDAPGNVGLLDQRLALQWVRENIHAFGGNPTRVTIFGQSAGGYSVHAHIISPLSRGLFHRAFMMSGTYDSIVLLDTLLESVDRGSQVAARLNCTAPFLDLSSHPDIVLECLRSKSTDALSNAVKNVTDPKLASFVPTYPNEFFPVRPVLALRQGRFADVDAMVSVTSSEGTVMVVSQPDKRFWDEDLSNVSVEELKPALREMLVTFMGNKYIDLVEYYAAQAAQDNKQELREMYTEFFGDSYFVCPMKYFSQKHSGKGNSVYSFVFGHRSVKSTLPEWSGVPHLADVPYYFGVPLWDYESYSDEDRNVSQEVMRAFSSFARYGAPKLNGVKWTRHTPWNPAVLWLQPGNYSTQYDIGDKNCGFWKQFME
ncbi:cholinesterase 1 [Ixodes scapularis]|uniref:cholinesterase 1 n=1 Tax=Ixodes scapularis TaxID=6945 RepID=UPI001A9EC78E|nr:cholinesterase 1 [Ixodes scapularis]